MTAFPASDRSTPTPWPLAGAAWLAGALAVTLALAIRIAHRDGFVPGWDVLGAAEGLAMLQALGLGEIWSFYLGHGYTSGGSAWNLFSAPYTLVPGALTALAPWGYWAHVVTLATMLAVVVALRWALAMHWRDAGVLLLAWGASATLLSWSVAGLAVMSAILPHVLALGVVLRLASRWDATLLAFLPIHLLSWHSQDLAQTIFVVFLAAAVLLRGVPWATRLVWLAGGGWQLATCLLWPTQPWARAVGHVTLAEAGTRLLELVPHALHSPGIDLPSFLLLGAVCTGLVRRRQGFWWVVVGVQAVLVGVLAIQAVNVVWPRRTILLLGYLMIATAACWADLGPTGRRRLLAALLVANAVQIADTIAWSREPLTPSRQGTVEPLPFAWSTRDYTVVPPLVRWYGEVRADVQAGRRVLLIYGGDAFPENATDPAGIPERLYLALGPERFTESVLLFGDSWRTVRHFPVRPVAELPDVVTAIDDPARVVGYRVTHRADAPAFRERSAAIVAALETRFELAWANWETYPAFGDLTIDRFTLREKSVAVD